MTTYALCGIITNKHKAPKLEKKHGASDARHLSDARIDAVCVGPTGDGLHSNNEWVNIKSLETFYQILSDFIINL